MSTTIMSVFWPLKMPASKKAVLISLADNANDHGHCWPSIDTICERTCLGRTTVIDAIKWLERENYLTADRSNGRKTTYQLHPNQYGRRTGIDDQTSTGGGRVRETDGYGRRTLPVRETDGYQYGSRTKPVREVDTNRQEPSVITVKEPSTCARKDAWVFSQADFNQFWLAYPKKVSKGQAERAWRKLKPDEQLHNRILKSVERAKTSAQWVKDGGKFIQHPATWLNAKGWENEVGPPQSAGDLPMLRAGEYT